MNGITATQISNFFTGSSRRAQELLPDLVQRLIFAQSDQKDIKRARFPKGDRISEHGFDGYVNFSGESQWVPLEKSVWEMGCDKNPHTKADKDWKAGPKRSWPQKKGGFKWVFVTPHFWSEQDREAWCDQKRQDSTWKDVTAFDATDLETWLSQCPSVASWFNQIIGLGNEELFTAEDQLRRFLPQLNSDIKAKCKLVIAGREKEVKPLEQFFLTEKKRIVVLGESRQEAALFIAAIALNSEILHNQISASSRLLFANSKQAIHCAENSIGETIIVPLSEEAEKVALSSGNEKLRIITLGIKKKIPIVSTNYQSIELPFMRSAPAIEALKNLGINERNAKILSKESKGSLHFLEWSLNENSEELPAWSKSENLYVFSCLWLVGQWCENNDNDRLVIENLSEKSWKEINGIILPELQYGGQFEKFGTMTDWKSWPSCLDYIDRALKDDILKRYKKLVLDVFFQHDPLVEMNSVERLTAQWQHISHPYSSSLRAGVLSSLAMIGVHVSRLRYFVDDVVEELLSGQGKKLGLRWATISRSLGDLAEAAPNVFLKACKKLARDKEACKCLFINEHDVINPRSFHCDIQWAIERLAWSEDYFSEAVDVLAYFVELNLKTFISSTPLGSLSDIFLPWHVSTRADSKLRVATFNQLATNHHDVAWRLACSIKPSPHSMTSGTHKPKWHNWLDDQKLTRTVKECFDFWDFIINWMIDQAIYNPEYWIELIGDLHHWKEKVYSETFEHFVESLENTELKNIPQETAIRIYDKLFEFICTHKQYSDADWALDSCSLGVVERIARKFKPNDVLLTNLWLFDSWPKYEEKLDLSYSEKEKYFDEKRIKAIKAIFDRKGLDAIFDAVLKYSDKARQLGRALGCLELDENNENEILIWGLDNPRDNNENYQNISSFVDGYFSTMISRIEKAYKDNWFENLLTKKLAWNNTMRINLSLLAPPNSKNWDIITKMGKDIEDQYWARGCMGWLNDSHNDLSRAVEKLLSVSRPCEAIDTMAMQLGTKLENKLNIDDKLIERAIREALFEGTDMKSVNMQMLPYYVDQLLQYLEKQGKTDQDLAGLEWGWMKALSHSKRGIKSLKKLMSTSPEFFVDILTMFSKEEGENVQTEPSKLEIQNAEFSFHLLHEWKSCPSSKYSNFVNKNQNHSDYADEIPFANGSVDYGEIKDYFVKARKLADERKRLVICDSYLGKILAYSPIGKDNIWPTEEVCALVEKLASDKLDFNICNGVFSKRGVHRIIPGGAGELKIVTQFVQYLEKRRQYPRTSRVLNKIIDYFKSEAKYNQENERLQDSWG